LIDQVGQVIENARLLEETERFAQREQRIHQITTRIRAAGDVQAVLEATTTELAQTLGVSRAIMRLTMSDPIGNGDQPLARTKPQPEGNHA
jgi:GAF domain-containing protein